MQIITTYSPWLILLCLLVGALYGFFLYRKDRKLDEFPDWLIYLLAFLRFFLVSLLCILLLAPLFQHLSKEVEEPIVIIAHDNSTSVMMVEDSAYYRTDYKRNITNLVDQLSKYYEVEEYVFGEGVKEGLENLDFSAKITDISKMLQEVEDRYSNRNVGALIVASDGIYNMGSNPVYSVQGMDFPIYTIALGDSTERRDLKINSIKSNQIAYFGNKFPIQVDISALKAKNRQFKLQVLKEGKVLLEESFIADSDDYFQSVSNTLLASEKGLQKYTVRVSDLEGEVSYKNNTKDFYIDILDGRQRILLLANSPHPDIKAIKESLEKSENYEVTGSLIREFNTGFENFDLVILHQLPSDQHQLSGILGDRAEDATNLFVFVGAQTNLALLNKSVEQLQINSSSRQFNEVQAIVNEGFPLFKLSDGFKKTVESLPPVYSPHGTYKVSGQNYQLLSQKIGMVPTGSPLLFFHQDAEKKLGVFAAEGIWKWKMIEYAQEQNTEIFDELITKSVQYLALKTDQSLFRVSSKNEFLENESIVFDAELYNSSYELINEAEVEIVIENEEGNSFPFSFSRIANAYTLNTGVLPVGDYSYKATVEMGGETLTENGQFTVKPIQLEENNIVADHQLLYQIAENSNGELFFPNELEDLEQNLRNSDNLKAVSYLQEETVEVINLKWIFFLLLSLLSMEWFLRKRNGAY